MQVLHGTDEVPASARGAALAIGNFDGVHRGHQALLEVAHDEAAKLRRSAGVILFEPHPREFFQPDRPHFRLTPLPLKLELIERFGLDLAVVLRFDAALAALSADAFIDRVLVDKLGAAHVVIGYDFRFGKGRGGDPETLQRAGAAHGFGVTVVAQVAEAGEVFSSGAIRAELAQGDVMGAAQMLGWWWRVSGKVTGGAKRGTGLGFPTANVALAPGTALAHGIYAVRVARRRHAATMPPPTSARDRHSTMARRCWRCSCSTSTATSTAATSPWSSSTSSAATAASTASTRSRHKWPGIATEPAKSWRRPADARRDLRQRVRNAATPTEARSATRICAPPSSRRRPSGADKRCPLPSVPGSSHRGHPVLLKGNNAVRRT